MSSHEGVSCDSCLKGNFSGKRYKCLICYDYDLCAACYEANVTSTHHSADHPMQCILTRADFDLFYGGETLSLEQQLSYTCPLCGRLGFTDLQLQEHVGIEHADASAEVVCPICACFPTGDPNHVVDDLAAHLLLEHRASTELDAQLGSIRSIRRMPHHGRSMAGARTQRRGNMQFQSTGAAALPVLSPGGRDRELMDPIAELLSQLSSARSRAAAAQSISSQLHQLEIQLQSSRYGTARQPQADRLLPSLGETVRASATIPACFGRSSGLLQGSADSSAPGTGISSAASTGSPGSGSAPSSSNARSGRSDFLLSRLKEQNLSESERQAKETERADKSLFVQELLLAMWAQESHDEPARTPDLEVKPPAVQVELPKLTSLSHTLKEVDARQVVNGFILSDAPSVLVKPVTVEENRAPVGNGLTYADGKFHATRNSGKLKPVVGRSGREQGAAAKRH